MNNRYAVTVLFFNRTATIDAILDWKGRDTVDYWFGSDDKILFSHNPGYCYFVKIDSLNVDDVKSKSLQPCFNRATPIRPRFAWEIGCCGNHGNSANNGARVVSAGSDLRAVDMSLTPHVNSVVTDRELTCTAHHVTLTIDRYDNIVYKRFVSCDADRSRQNVGQMTDDSSFLLDNTKTSNMVSKHKSHSHISKSNMKFSVTPFQQILVASINALTKTVHNNMSSFDNKMSGFDNRMSNFGNEMSSFENKMSNFGNKMSSFENKMSNFDNRMSNVENMMSHFRSEMSSLRSDLSDQRSSMDRGFRIWGLLCLVFGLIWRQICLISKPV